MNSLMKVLGFPNLKDELLNILSTHPGEFNLEDLDSMIGDFNIENTEILNPDELIHLINARDTLETYIAEQKLEILKQLTNSKKPLKPKHQETKKDLGNINKNSNTKIEKKVIKKTRTVKLYEKFKQDPHSFFNDSKKKYIRGFKYIFPKK